MKASIKGSLPGGRSEAWHTYARLLRRAKPYRTRLLLGTVFGAVFGFSIAGVLVVFKGMLGSLLDPEQTQFGEILMMVGILLAFGAVRSLGDFMSRYFVGWVGSRVVMDLRRDTFAHLHDLPILFFSKSRSGELISRTTNDTAMIQAAVSNVVGDLLRQPFAALGAVIALIHLDARLALISLMVFPVCILPVALFGRRVKKYGRQSQERLAGLVSILQETIYGASVVKAFGMEGYERKKFDGENTSVFRRTIKVLKAKASVEPIVVFISCVGLSLVILYAYYFRLTADALVVFGIALVALYDPIKKLSRVHLTIAQSVASAERVFEILDTKPDVTEAPDALVFDEPIREIAFDHVSFSYGEEKVLDDVHLSVRSGEIVALVGSSGAGKTTLVNLIPRLFDVTEGSLLLNGKDIRSLTFASLRLQVGVVTQETILFNDTVSGNIAYGQTDASPASIAEAARKANAHDFIMEMADGYDTVIHERGARLSGGQRQRLAIARAVLRNPPILILDEATSALDTESERLVQDALYELMSGRTVFAIAHRLSTIRHADRILVLDKGRIVEEGEHGDLLAGAGIYKRLHDMQFRDQVSPGVG